MAKDEDSYYRFCDGNKPEPATLKLNANYRQPRSHILILGHNSKLRSLMDGFDSYRGEWNDPNLPTEVIEVSVIDDPAGLASVNYYEGYPYIKNVVQADIYDQELVYDTIRAFINENEEEKGILILSDDLVSADKLDTKALTYLIYVQDILSEMKKEHKVQAERVDVIAEILDPKNYDVVKSYNVDNIIISNRYLSKMITQIGEKEALFEFYSDILKYDEEEVEDYESMELYIKKVRKFFDEVPDECSAYSLIRGIYEEKKKMDPNNISILLGYITKENEMILLSSNQKDRMVKLQAEDRLILFSNH